MSARGQAGEVSLAGLLVGTALMLVVTAATLGLFDGISRVVTDGSRRAASQDAARGASDRIGAALRNLASPSPEIPRVVEVAGPKDLVFTTVDPVGPNGGANTANVERVRYCLDAAGRLQGQTQTWTTAAAPAVPSTSGCPATGWGRTQVLAEGVVNGAVPVFSYDAAAAGDVAGIHVELLVDADPAHAPGATRLATGVFLRNQNRRPAAAFVVSRSPGRVVLNGSASSDPESRPLSYAWFDGAAAIGTGITLDLALAAGSSHSFSLRVSDPAGLTATSAPQAVTG